MDFMKLREQIPVCKKLVYVNTGWSGPSPLAVTTAIKDRLEYEMEDGPTTPEVLASGKEIQVKAREAVAGLLNAIPEEICLTQNTTAGLNIVMNGLQWSEGDEIITCDLEHSSVLTPGYFRQHRHGAVLKVLHIATNEEKDSIVEKFRAALTERTKLIFISHIQYSSGLRMPVKEIREMTKDRGVLMLLDGAQTAGQIPLDVKELDCDFYSIPAQKWLLGPEGAGALYIRRELIPEVEPTAVSSKASLVHDDPYEFEANTDSIDKFLLTSSSYALIAGFTEAIKFINDVGVRDIERRNIYLASHLKYHLQQMPYVKILSPLRGSLSSGLVSFSIDGVDPKEFVAELWERHQIVARPVGYPPCVRVSLHFFNTRLEVNNLLQILRKLK